MTPVTFDDLACLLEVRDDIGIVLVKNPEGSWTAD